MEQATLTIQRKMQTGAKYAVYRDLFRAYKNGESFEKVLLKNQYDTETFGKVSFVEDRSGVYFEHLPNNTELNHHQLQCSMNIPPEWLFCFSFQEMRVIGLDMGVFQAQTTVDLAMQRLQWLDIDFNHPLYQKVNEIYLWLKTNARLEDRIRLSSEWIYYHPNGKYDYFYVRQDINRRVARIKEHVHCPHWTKKVS